MILKMLFPFIISSLAGVFLIVVLYNLLKRAYIRYTGEFLQARVATSQKVKKDNIYQYQGQRGVEFTHKGASKYVECQFYDFFSRYKVGEVVGIYYNSSMPNKVVVAESKAFIFIVAEAIILLIILSVSLSYL